MTKKIRFYNCSVGQGFSLTPYILSNIEHNVTWELKNERAEPYNRQFTTLFPLINEIFGS